MENKNGYILHLNGTGDAGKAIPLGLSGYPTKDSEGNPIFYRRAKIATCKAWTHRGSGEQFEITRARADEWVKNTAALAAAGVKPFIPGEHRDKFNAADNYGFIERIERDGDDVYAVQALYGDDSLKIAARNGRSIYVVKDAMDANGNVYPGETISHVALVPNPALPDLGGTVSIAASADMPSRDVPVFELAGTTTTPVKPRRSYRMKPENAALVRSKLGITADVPDDQLDDKTAEVALQLSATVSTLTADLASAKTDAESKSQQVLSLSASLPKTPDALTLSMFQENIEAKREAAISSGAISAADAKAFDGMLADTNGTPNVLALSAVGTTRKPFAFQFWDALAKLGTGIKTGTAVPREAVPSAALALSGSQRQDKKPLSEAEFRDTLEKTGTHATSDDYASYLKNRTA